MENDFTSLKKGIKRNNKLTNLIIYILQRKENNASLQIKEKN